VKIAIAQLNYHIGNFEANTQKIISTAKSSHQNGAELTVFAELAVSGYPPRDFLEFDDFIQKCEVQINLIAEACFDIPLILGSPVRNTTKKGKPLFNAAVFLYQGQKEYFRKGLLPDYDVFDEYRYFEPADSFQCLKFNDHKIAVTVCEDLWNVEDHPLYVKQPMEDLILEKPDLIINIAASPFDYAQAEKRETVLRKNVDKYKLPLVYVNHVGAQTELLFDGGSMVMDENGMLISRLKFFDEEVQIVDVGIQFAGNQLSVSLLPEKIERIHDALVMGVRNYFQKLGFQKAVLGLSGGIDSAVTMVLAARALGSENVHAVLMPSQFSSDHSVQDALDLAKNLGSTFQIIPIKEIYESFEHALHEAFVGKAFDVTEENIQARIRGALLMALSNKFGMILLNTSNKSETAVGYGTLYGDMNGGLSVLGDVYKTEVFELARFINRKAEIIPENTIIKPPSAELRPEQQDSDSLPDYSVLDKILFAYIEQRLKPEAIAKQGIDSKIVAHVLRLVNLNEYKRHQSPPILRVSAKAFGIGRRMPIVAKYLS
jgi:NAD+ synthase (glutamine-hydrolysing)